MLARWLVSCLLPCVAAAPVGADCPSAADLSTGIRVISATGESETFTTVAPDVVASVYDDGHGYANRVLMAQGVYLLELVDLENGDVVPETRLVYGHPQGPQAFPAPAPGTTYSATVTMREGSDVWPEAQGYVFGRPSRIAIGACGYDLIEVTVTYADAEDTVETVHYLPELGVSYLAASEYTTVEGRLTDRYAYGRIEALRR